MSRRHSDAFWGLLDEIIRERTGLTGQRLDVANKERLIAVVMKRAGVHHELAYLELLKRDAKAFDELISELTVPETYFFRDPPNFELLRREVLPSLLRARSSEHVIEVWSAGCASGEEAYSLVMLLEQEALGLRSRVLGTDVSRRALDRAKRATYGAWSLRATQARDVNRYFEPVGRDYRLVPRIRDRVSFEQRSLSSLNYPRPTTNMIGFDLILCRNVLIYFDAAAAAGVGQQLARSLSPEGFLMMGPSDPLLDIEDLCELVPTSHGMLYQRRGAEKSVTPRRTAQAREPAPWVPAASSARAPTSAPMAAMTPATPSKATLKVPTPAPAPEARSSLDQVHAIAREHGLAAAETACRDWLEREPLTPAAHFTHASLLVDLGRQDAAEEALRRALYLDRGLLVAHMLHATLLAHRGELSTAQRTYEQLNTWASERPVDEPVPLGEGLTHGSIAQIARQRADAVRRAEALLRNNER